MSKQIEIDGMAKLRTCLELLGADIAGRVRRIRGELLERLPIGCQATIANTLKVMDRLGLIGNVQSALHEECKLVGKAEMGLGVGRKHPP